MSCVCVRICAFARAAVGRSVGRRSGKKSLSFPHSQGAASHTSVRLVLYTLSWNSPSTNNSPGRPKKKTLAERILRNESTVSSSSTSSSCLCSCLLPRKLICRCKPRPRKSELPLSKSPLDAFPHCSSYLSLFAQNILVLLVAPNKLRI